MYVAEENKNYKLYLSEPYNKEQIITFLNTKISSLMTFFEIKEINQITIYLYDDQDKFLEHTKYPYQIGPLAGAYNYYQIMVYSDLTKISLNQLYNCIAHEMVHLIYQNYIRERTPNSKTVWFEEGLAQVLSGEKGDLLDDEKFREFLDKNIYAEGKEIPRIKYLKRHGDKYGEFIDRENNSYNGYHWSYLMVRYLFETTSLKNINKIMRSKQEITILERFLPDSAYYYYRKKSKSRSN